jgi:nitrile hydratase subunit beta
MGGMDGFGAVVREDNEPLFHFDWEARIFALLLACRPGNIDELRHAIERIAAPRYLNSTYHERWLDAVEILLMEKGVISRAELQSRGADPTVPVQPPGHFEGPPYKTSRRRARFCAGDRVIARNLNTIGHTRLPRYARGKRGVIGRDWGVFAFPDSNAHGGGQRPQHVYSVAFQTRELWGASAPSRDKVHLDLWEDYLEADKSAEAAAKRGKPAKAGRRGSKL